MAGLTPTAVRLLRLLKLEDRDGKLARATNDEFAELLGVTARSVTTALSRLVDAELIAIDTRRGHPATDPTGRTLRFLEPDGDGTSESSAATPCHRHDGPDASAEAACEGGCRARPRHQVGGSPATGFVPDAISFDTKGVASCPLP